MYGLAVIANVSQSSEEIILSLKDFIWELSMSLCSLEWDGQRFSV